MSRGSQGGIITFTPIEDLQELLVGCNILADALFVAVDFENTDNIIYLFKEGRTTEFGISVLDTRDLHNHLELQTNGQKLPTREFISTKNFCTGNPADYKQAVRNFRFGVSEAISIYEIAGKIREFLYRLDEETGEFRHVVLIFHRASVELKMLSKLRINVRTRMDHRLAILDTAMISEQIFTTKGHPLSLRSLAARLNIPSDEEMFHNAGNDAEMALRVLLMLAVHRHEEHSWGRENEALMTLLKEIGQSPLPSKRTALEQQKLEALQPESSLDDPNAPIDTSKFSIRKTRREVRIHARQRELARKLADPRFRRPRPPTTSEENEAITEGLDGLKVRDLNIQSEEAHDQDKGGYAKQGKTEQKEVNHLANGGRLDRNKLADVQRDNMLE